MSVSEQITRLQNARNKIRTKLAAMGLVDSTAKIDACADAIDEMQDNGNVSATIQEGQTYTIPKGFHSGSGTVSAVAGGGNYTLQSKSVTPTKKQQNITPDEGFYGLSDVTVEVIPAEYQDVSDVTATAEDTLAGKIIVLADGSVTPGTMVNNGAVNETIDGLTTLLFKIPKGYHDGNGTVSLSNDIETALASI